MITVEGSEERHQEIILATITQRAQEIFAARECKPGFELDDWLNAEKELWRDDDLNAPEFFLVVDSPKDSQLTMILSLTARSLEWFFVTEREIPAKPTVAPRSNPSTCSPTK